MTMESHRVFCIWNHTGSSASEERAPLLGAFGSLVSVAGVAAGRVEGYGASRGAVVPSVAHLHRACPVGPLPTVDACDLSFLPA